MGIRHSPEAYGRLTRQCFPDWPAEAVAWQAAGAFIADFGDCGLGQPELAAQILAALA